MTNDLKPGDRVKMSDELKQQLRGRCGEAGEHVGPFDDGECWVCSSPHVDEFGECEGIVEDVYQPGCPEVNVRWQPSNLRYAYHPKHLVRVG